MQGNNLEMATTWEEDYDKSKIQSYHTDSKEISLFSQLVVKTESLGTLDVVLEEIVVYNRG